MTRLLVADIRSRAPAWAPPAEALGALRNAVPLGWRLHLVEASTISDGDGNPNPAPEVLRAIADAEVYFGFGFSRPLLDASPGLRWIQTATAGVRSLLALPLADRGIALTNAAGIHAEPMADLVLGGVLYFLRGLDVAAAQQREQRWHRDPWVNPDNEPLPVQAREIADCRVLVVGAGGIGSAVARRFAALGATCVGLRRRPQLGAPDGFNRVAGLDAIDGELAAADVVVLAAPATDETERVLDARRIGLLGRGAIVVNVARGTLVDEAALAEALAAGRIRGAVLDVFEREPLPAESPLWRLPNALLTPHVSAVSPARFWNRMMTLFLENWGRYQRGEQLMNLVDTSAGY